MVRPTTFVELSNSCKSYNKVKGGRDPILSLSVTYYVMHEFIKFLIKFLQYHTGQTSKPGTKTEMLMTAVKLSDNLQFAGVAITNSHLPIKRILEKLNLNIISMDEGYRNLELKDLIAAVAQSEMYPDSKSHSFVILIFISGRAHGTLVQTLQTKHGLVSIVDDIIKPFLPQSAPHLIHIPKLFFISSYQPYQSYHLTSLPEYPTNPDDNYFVAYHTSHDSYDQWMYKVVCNLSSSELSVDSIHQLIGTLRGSTDAQTISCLKHSVVFPKFKESKW